MRYSNLLSRSTKREQAEESAWQPTKSCCCRRGGSGDNNNVNYANGSNYYKRAEAERGLTIKIYRHSATQQNKAMAELPLSPCVRLLIHV